MEASVLGDRISYARKVRGLTLDAVAQEVGVHKSTIQRYEKGEYANPKLPVIESIARALSVNPSWLIGKSDNMEPGPAPEETNPATGGDGKMVNDDPELTEILEYCKNDPYMRMLFSVTKGAKREDIAKAIKIIQAVRGE